MKKRVLISFFTIFFIMVSQINANPTFSKKYNMKCSGCHSMLPTLNANGLKFLRNGFRFDRNETTTLDGFLHAKDWKERTANLPITMLVGFNINSKDRKDVDKLNFYSGGTLTDTLSFYAISRSNYNAKVNHVLFSESSSRAFLEWNPKGPEHVLKLGWMDPLMGISNLSNRTLMDSGLVSAGLIKAAPANKLVPSWYRTPVLPSAPGADATPQEIKKYQMKILPKQVYKAPVPNASFGLVKGIEYSYLHNEKMLFLVNYGIPTAEPFASDEDSQLTLAFELQDVKGANIGIVYLHKEIANIDIDSYILPIEKYFMGEQLLLRTNFVYKDSTQYENPYYGNQTSMTYAIDEDTHVRVICAVDKDEAKNSNTALSFTYSKLFYDRYIIHLTGARHKGKVFDESVAKLSLYMFI